MDKLELVELKKKKEFCLCFLYIHSFYISYVLQRRDSVKEIEVVIDTEEMADFFYEELIRRGFVPSSQELEELADIMFDYLIVKSIIDEEEEEE